MDALGFRLVIAASPTSIYSALTDAVALQMWLDEFAEVDIASGRFDFWGRHSPQPERGRKALLAFEQVALLRFSWLVKRHLTTVEITIEPDPIGASVTIIQRNLPPRVGAEPSVMDFWRLSLDNLANYAEGRPIAARAEMGEQQPGAGRAEIEIEASPDAVFRAITEPAELNRWIATNARVDPTVGGRIDFGWDHGPISILEIEPNRALAYGWSWGDSGETVVRWELAGSHGKTRVTLVHSGFARQSDAEGYKLGWQAFLSTLKRMLELGPDWQPQTWVDPNGG